MEYKQFYQANQINRTSNALFIIRTPLIIIRLHTQNYIPCLGQKGQNYHILSCSTSLYSPSREYNHVHPPGLWLPVNAKCVSQCPVSIFCHLFDYSPTYLPVIIIISNCWIFFFFISSLRKVRLMYV